MYCYGSSWREEGHLEKREPEEAVRGSGKVPELGCASR